VLKRDSACALICSSWAGHRTIKDRSAAELDEMFAERIPARAFKGTEISIFTVRRVKANVFLLLTHVCTRIQEIIEIDFIGKNGITEIEIINEPSPVGA
jgi:hypothetical protein